MAFPSEVSYTKEEWVDREYKRALKRENDSAICDWICCWSCKIILAVAICLVAIAVANEMIYERDDCGELGGNNRLKDCAGVFSGKPGHRFGKSELDGNGDCCVHPQQLDSNDVCCDGFRIDCGGVCNGTNVRDFASNCCEREDIGCGGMSCYQTFDRCKICGGDNSSLGCDGCCFSGATYDDNGVCSEDPECKD